MKPEDEAGEPGGLNGLLTMYLQTFSANHQKKAVRQALNTLRYTSGWKSTSIMPPLSGAWLMKRFTPSIHGGDTKNR